MEDVQESSDDDTVEDIPKDNPEVDNLSPEVFRLLLPLLLDSPVVWGDKVSILVKIIKRNIGFN